METRFGYNVTYEIAVDGVTMRKAVVSTQVFHCLGGALGFLVSVLVSFCLALAGLGLGLAAGHAGSSGLSLTVSLGLSFGFGSSTGFLELHQSPFVKIANVSYWYDDSRTIFSLVAFSQNLLLGYNRNVHFLGSQFVPFHACSNHCELLPAELIQ